MENSTSGLTFIIRWKDRQYPDYDPSLDGKKVVIPYYYYLKIDGKPMYSKLYYLPCTVGEDQTVEVPEEIDGNDGYRYPSEYALDVYIMEYFGDAEIRQTMTQNFGSRVANTFPNTPIIIPTQNMSIFIETTIEEDSIILASDQENILVEYTVKEEITGVYPVKGKRMNDRDNVIYQPGVFRDKQKSMLLGSPYYFASAVSGNALKLFDRGQRINEFTLVASFGGNDKEHLDKCYSLEVEGSDITGWKVILSSKIKEKTRVEEEIIDFETIYQDDPTQPVGYTEVLQKGITGKSEVATNYYYLLNDDGAEEILESQEPVKTVVEPVDEIIIRGTKTKDPAANTEESSTHTEEKTTVTNESVREPASSVKLTFAPAGGTWPSGSTEPMVIYASIGDFVRIPLGPNKEGAKFVYWEGSRYNPGDMYEVTGEHNFTAHYEDYVSAFTGINASDAASNKIEDNIQKVADLPKTGEQSTLAIVLTSIGGLGLIIALRKKLGR